MITKSTWRREFIEVLSKEIMYYDTTISFDFNFDVQLALGDENCLPLTSMRS